MFLNKLSLGKKGERIAKKFLRKKKLKFITNNFVYKKKEVDLIFKDEKNKTLIFVEVKTRSDDSFATPEDNINSAKIKKYDFVINGFLMKYPQYKNYGIRIDSVGVTFKGGKVEINHLEGINQAF